MLLSGVTDPWEPTIRNNSSGGMQQQGSNWQPVSSTGTKAEQKTVILEELEEQGVLFDALSEQVGKDYDPFDLICKVAFGQPPMSRKERAAKVRKANYFTKYGEGARKVLDVLLLKYSDRGIADIESMEVLRVDPFNQFGTPLEIVNTIFGGKDNYLSAQHTHIINSVDNFEYISWSQL
jgi:type I restriction enzyme, R subunit